MIQTRQILEQYKDKYPDFEYYYTIVQEVEDNAILHPDICIESCKSLIEGISKSVIERTDKTQTREEIDKKDFMPLYQEAIRRLDAEYHSITVDQSMFEIEICNQFGKQIDKLNTLRNKRSDISHGRAVPKEFNSNTKLARTIKGVADHIVAYILEHLFILLDTLPKDLLQPYDCKDYEEFNEFLDSEYENFPISKARYSQVLYDYEPETYFVKYKDFTPTIDGGVTITTEESFMEDIDTTIEREGYDVYNFWTEMKLSKINDYCHEWKINSTRILELIDKYEGEAELISSEELFNSFYEKLDRMENAEMIILLKQDIVNLLRS